MRPTAPCKLCDRTAPLHQSHVIPAAAERKVRRDHAVPGVSADPVLIDSDGMVQKSPGNFEYMLCSECEARFKRAEDRVVALAADVTDPGAPPSFPFLQAVREEGCRMHSWHQTRACDGRLLAYFAASVVWRSHSATRRVIGGVDLGAKYGRGLRPYLLGRAPRPKWISVSLSIVGNDGGTGTVAYSLTYPLPVNDGRPFYMHHFALPGLHFMISVGQKISGAVLAEGVDGIEGRARVYVGDRTSIRSVRLVEDQIRQHKLRPDLRRKLGLVP